ncbi:hypothetical protein HDA32_000229 [Spinactinospora alkalitolerans]|uniref:RING-type E3 ubiquitin transferase n=1 Tax=Spinactinospora alkalitolerans TaxID=687207 RepID=A0A852TMD4_9ACTN|nr:GIDE domain-containing protein [Spinactinospora alkalitolerans]NYE45109.1 hypothetical protein [Spinactinospora alkalitolerans]
MENTEVWALILGGIAAVGFFLGWRARRRRLALLDTPTMTCAQLAEATAGARAVVSEVVGQAEPGPAGPLTAPFSGSPCVWYRTEVVRHYRKRVRDGKGNHRTQNRRETVEKNASHQPFQIRDTTGRVAFDPAGADVDSPAKSHQRYERGSQRRATAQAAQGGSGGIAQVAEQAVRWLGDGSGTKGYTYREWILRPEQRLFALGQVRPHGSELVMSRPDDRPFVLSTRSEEALLKNDWLFQRICFGGALALAVAAMGILVYGLFF